MDDLGDSRQVGTIGELELQALFVAEQDEAEVGAALIGKVGAGDHHRRSDIAAHRVDCDPRPAAQNALSRSLSLTALTLRQTGFHAHYSGRIWRTDCAAA